MSIRAPYFRAFILVVMVMSAGFFMLNAANQDSLVVGEIVHSLNARYISIFLTLALIVVTYFWAKEIVGRWWAFLPAFLTAFSPTILAFGHLATADIFATVFTLLAIIYFTSFLLKPNKSRLFLVGLIFGASQLTNSSTNALFLYFTSLLLIFYLVSLSRDWHATESNRLRRFSIRLYRYISSLIVILLIGYLIAFIFSLLLVPGYLEDRSFASISQGFGGFLIDKTTTLSTASEGLTYFAGKIYQTTPWFYYPSIFLLKETPVAIIFIIFAFLYAIWNCIKAIPRAIFTKMRPLFEYLETHFLEFSALLFIVIFWLSAMASGSGLGMRHLMPALPMIYILTAAGVKTSFSIKSPNNIGNFAFKMFVLYKELYSVAVKFLVLFALLIWQLISVSVVAPNFLAYFNIFNGGSAYGYRYSVASDYDWGQDLKRLKEWAGQTLESDEKIAVDYFGGDDVRIYLGDQVELWWPAKNNPTNEGINWLAISVHNLQLATKPLADGLQRTPEDEYQWLENPFKPTDKAGRSIFIFKLE